MIFQTISWTGLGVGFAKINLFFFSCPQTCVTGVSESARRPHGILKRSSVCSPRLAVIVRQDSDAGLSARECRDLEYQSPLAPDLWPSVKKAEAGDALTFTHVTCWQTVFPFTLQQVFAVRIFHSKKMRITLHIVALTPFIRPSTACPPLRFCLMLTTTTIWSCWSA